MRESFIFYKSFYDAIEFLGEKAQLKLYKSIMKLNFNCCESETELIQLCDEIEMELKQNRQAFAQFLLIKPQLLANFKKYLNGCKGAQFGALGGAQKGNKNAKKQPQNNPKTTPNENEQMKNENVEYRMKNENENKNNILNSNFQNHDLFFDKEVNQIFSFYKKICTNLVPIVFEERNLERRQEIKNFLYLVSNNLTYVQELFERANKQVSFYDNKINLKSLIKNHESIYQGIGAPKDKENNAKKFDEGIKKLEAKFRAQEVLNDTR